MYDVSKDMLYCFVFCTANSNLPVGNSDKIPHFHTGTDGSLVGGGVHWLAFRTLRGGNSIILHAVVYF